MPPPLLFDLSGVDLSRTHLSRAEIYEHLPHRHEFMLLDGICYEDASAQRLVAYVDVRADAWWCRGHVPGRPLLPGVLMLEMAGQASGLLARRSGGYPDFIAYGGVQACKFRDAVVPPARLHILVEGREYRRRRITSAAQGIVDGKLVFEAIIVGLVMP